MRFISYVNKRSKVFLWPVFLFVFIGLASPVSALATPRVSYPGLMTLERKLGPILVKPGDNRIYLNTQIKGPDRSGFITRFKPDLVRVEDGQPTPVEQLHIHHAGWTINGRPAVSSGVEKTIAQQPRGFGTRVRPGDRWGLVYMLHNQVSTPQRVYLTWKADFLPDSSPAAKRMHPTSAQWMDVGDTARYSTFDAIRGWGGNGRYTFPDEANGREKLKVGRQQSWVVPGDVTLVYTTGHVHPGSLHATLTARRGGLERRLFRSEAKYFSSKPKYSYDFAMTASPPSWRVKLQKGDVVSINATVDTSATSWFEQMGIMLVSVYKGHDVGGSDPFAKNARIPTRGKVTHGSLPENRSLGGSPTRLPDPRGLPDGSELSKPIVIQNFRYQFGDRLSSGLAARPPVVSEGQRLSFVNLDAGSVSAPVYHTITACRAPCTATTGGAYPLANASQGFDSGQLGLRSVYGASPAKGSLSWSTPDTLDAGTYAFFCRVHPSMRGSFRVKAAAPSGLESGWPSLPTLG